MQPRSLSVFVALSIILAMFLVRQDSWLGGILLSGGLVVGYRRPGSELMLPALLIGVVALSTTLITLTALVWWIRRQQVSSLKRARETFHLRREWLEADFLTRAGASGKPRGLRWVNCDFEDGVAFARDRRTGRYRALVGVTISFEAIEGGGMEDVEAVGNLRAATVVFRLDGPEWRADGRALFNLNPAEAIAHFQHELENVE